MPPSAEFTACTARSAAGLFLEVSDTASIWSGMGVSHAGDEFCGVLHIEQVFSGGPFSLRYCARSPEAGLLHAEISTFFLNVEGQPSLATISNNMRICLVFKLSNLAIGNALKQIDFIERDSGIDEKITYGFEPAGKLTVKHQWRGASGDTVAESWAVLTPGAHNVPYKYADVFEFPWNNTAD
ncbi:hypothetical protein ACQKGC_28270 [Allorhizobium pseudoryzae]|uniref:hypothetical protein n=1 Tax=Allorhizobium pseudoryzae TaxID=379684 RepID=UPI003CFFEC1C